VETITLPNGHIVLPLEICRRLGIEAGTRLEVDFDDKTGCIRLHPLNDYIDVFQREKAKKRYRKRQLEKKLKAR
jgi:bifunctional DNA-binding transcriptional regulator/antitoxin component of YhaV-PrlF toxin-antitoxin module